MSSEPTGQDDISTVNGKPQNINPDRIFYPAMENQNSRRYRHVEPPRSFQRRLRARGCNSTSFCVESKSYPTELIDILIEVNSKLPSRFINKFLKEITISTIFLFPSCRAWEHRFFFAALAPDFFSNIFFTQLKHKSSKLTISN